MYIYFLALSVLKLVKIESKLIPAINNNKKDMKEEATRLSFLYQAKIIVLNLFLFDAICFPCFLLLLIQKKVLI